MEHQCPIHMIFPASSPVELPNRRGFPDLEILMYRTIFLLLQYVKITCHIMAKVVSNERYQPVERAMTYLPHRMKLEPPVAMMHATKMIDRKFPSTILRNCSSVLEAGTELLFVSQLVSRVNRFHRSAMKQMYIYRTLERKEQHHSFCLLLFPREFRGHLTFGDRSAQCETGVILGLFQCGLFLLPFPLCTYVEYVLCLMVEKNKKLAFYVLFYILLDFHSFSLEFEFAICVG